MTADKAPRRWWIDPCRHPDSEHDFYFGDALSHHPRQGPLQWQSSLIEVIEASAYDALAAELSREKKKVEKLREQRNRAYEAIYSGEAGEWACDPSVWIDFDEKQLKDIDKESEGAR